MKKFVTQHYSIETWEELNRKCGTSGDYEITKSYPLREIDSIVSQASTDTGLSVNELKETFGEYMVPDLFELYKNYVNTAWRTYDILKYTETVFHGAVRKLNSTAAPPVLAVTEVGNNVLIIDYYSRRRMGGVAVGIIRGIARYYNESDAIVIIPKTDPNAERVQIQVEFANR